MHPAHAPAGLQAYISRARVDSFSLTADLMYVSSNAPRISRALFEICLRRNWSSAAELCLTMSKVGRAKGLGAMARLHGCLFVSTALQRLPAAIVCMGAAVRDLTLAPLPPASLFLSPPAGLRAAPVAGAAPAAPV